MGRKSAEIERDLEQQREALHQRVERLEERLRSDAETTRNRMNERRHALTDNMPDQLNPSQMREHPKSLLLGAFGAGLSAGLVSEAVGGSRKNGQRTRWEQERWEQERWEQDRYERERGRQQQGSGFAVSMVERTFGPAISTFQAEATQYLEDTVRGLFRSGDGERQRGQDERQASRNAGSGSQASS